jgi:hypothetical protein
MTRTRSSRTGLATVACATLMLPACEGRDCRATEMNTHDAAVVDSGEVTSSAVLEARLTAGGKAVVGRTVAFHVRSDDGGMEFAGYADTSSDGIARLDLKEDPAELAGGANADSYRAAFDGDARYCSSRDEGNLDLVALP